ncbi:nuclease-related domain-containing protein [Aureibacillus halotolerans]|uniref:Nuclease-like protein n=1 Tax=Aureibacillus halotolerans TaxID=1508390 RepID=A0A4V6PWD9_9BACI|nr:nuclease-related domain-containing protein [Aureibacillus halotolerans]TDQ36127.1 nuclease-like protein [Aureibacillus halotolerans]
MHVKTIDEPLPLRQLNTLLSRLPKNASWRKLIEEDLAKRKAGLTGENSLDYYLPFLDQNDFIFQDLRLPTGSTFVQMDLLILTPAFILIGEVKNIAGTVTFDSKFQQFYRTYRDQEQTLPNPLFQVQRQKNRLLQWLQENRYPIVPILSLILFTDSRTRILAPDSFQSSTLPTIGHAEILPSTVETLKKQYPKTKLRPQTTNRLVEQLLKSHRPQRIAVMEKFGVTCADLIKGILCPTCKTGIMVRFGRSWKCPNCAEVDRTAHVHAIQDYAWLIKNEATNQELRHFLNISSRHVMKKLIHSMHLSLKEPYKSGKNNIYIIPD